MAEHLNAFTQNCDTPTSNAYDPFGNVKKAPGSIDRPFQFSTKQYDLQTGLSYYGYRFYSPQLGRWINRDPLGEAGGVNLYRAMGNNAVNNKDPKGLEVEYGYFYGVIPTPIGTSLNVNFSSYFPEPAPPGPPGSGCGDEKTDCIVPDLYPEACKAHDSCYSTRGKSQAQCDNEFWANMVIESGPWPNVVGPTFYWIGVRVGGGDAFRKAQGEK